MNVKIEGSSLSRIMKVLVKCIDPKDEKKSNVEITHNGSDLTFRATNGFQFVSMSVAMLGGNGETVCVDGKTLNSVASIQRGEVDIQSDGHNVYVKGNGRTRLTEVSVDLPKPPTVNGNTVTVKAGDLKRAYDNVSYAVATDDSRIVLTGVFVEVESGVMKLVALDGFQMSIEKIPCSGDDMKVIIPATLMDRICDCVSPEDTVSITTDRIHVRMSVDDAEVIGSVLVGEYVDYKRILPENFATESQFKTDDLVGVLRGNQVISDGKSPVKFTVGRNELKVQNNGEKLGYEAEIGCETVGNEQMIAFNARFVQNALNVLHGEHAVIHINQATTPAVITEKDGDGIHLFLPVRVF